MAIKKIHLGQSRGSLIPLSFGFFLLSMSLVFISINVASAYTLKRELTNIAESAINKSAQSINILAYYGQINRFSSNKKVPLDCLAANLQFYSLINQVQIKGRGIMVESFACSWYEVSAQIAIITDLPITIPFIELTQIKNLTIRSKVGASSVYMPN